MNKHKNNCARLHPKFDALIKSGVPAFLLYGKSLSGKTAAITAYNESKLSNKTSQINLILENHALYYSDNLDDSFDSLIKQIEISKEKIVCLSTPYESHARFLQGHIPIISMDKDFTL